MSTEKELSTDTDTRADAPADAGAGDGHLANLAQNAEELLRRTASYGSAEIEAGRDRLKRQWDAAEDQVADWRDAAGDGLRRFARAADECAHRHAWESIGVAALVGAALAACWLSRRR